MKDTLNQLSNDPRIIKIMAKAGEQGRISGILLFYKEKYPETANIIDKIIAEVENGS